MRKTLDIKDEFDTADMAKAFHTVFRAQVFTKGQLLAFEFRGINLSVTINDVQLVDLDALRKGTSAAAPGNAAASNYRGILMPQTNINFVKAPDSSIRLKGTGYS